MDILTTPVFDHPLLFSPGFIIMFEISIEVDRPFQTLAKEICFENSSCICGYGGKYQ